MSVSARSFDADPEAVSRTQLELTPQFVYFKADQLVFGAYGAEFGALYRTTENWDVGASLRQVYSIANGGAALISAVNMKARWHITGGNLPTSKRWKASGKTAVVQNEGASGGLHLDPEISQVTFNTTGGAQSYSGIGTLIGYDFGWSEDTMLGLGLGVSRFTNGQTSILPIRATASWQVYF